MYRSMKDDPDTNVQFVQTVEMFPCLYDYTTKEYSIRNAKYKAWGEIGKKFDANMSECKERWKNLRACFTRHLKAKPPSGSAAKIKKPYYLAEFLHFLEPFTKSRKQSGYMPALPPLNNECSEQNEIIGNFSESEEDNIDNNPIEDNPNDSNSSFTEPKPQQWISSTKSSSFQKKQRSVGLEEVNKAALDFFAKKKKSDLPVEDVDLCFFKSLLPDMKLMNPEQKRRFKFGVLSLIGNILDEPNETIPIQTEQNLYHTGYNREYQNMEK
ncbi:uncharacterized protein LOC103310953 [Acyrthosiphon pisum]|uniref:MADF domain-containing protein n=1 Tax=Acyrthosiphon pisum TaxID=7029 RepID=A0A8R2BAA7_ACYPI|nr:uncharacterized protein LOC103310953 [Acyrthosiphon pisum]|eukprot:XP_008188674.1 PREDICTED: uncharacterized protein LOC103310953 [Acyrthosiphon pisum]